MTREEKTRGVQEWLAGRPYGTLVVTDWVCTEFSSAVSLKVRARQIDPRHKDAALTMFSDWCEGTFVMEAISQPDFAVAAHYAARDDVDIRAGDALHAAACMRLGTTMCTLDAKLRAACEFLGIGTETL